MYYFMLLLFMIMMMIIARKEILFDFYNKRKIKLWLLYAHSPRKGYIKLVVLGSYRMSAADELYT